MTRLVLAVLALLSASASAQGLRLHAAVTADAPGDRAGLRSLTTEAGVEAWVGQAVLDLPPSSIATVGLEEDANGTSTVSVWLAGAASVALTRVTEASTGTALAVLHDGRLMSAARIAGPVTNGLVQIPGLRPAVAERLAAALRGETAAPPPAAPPGAAPPGAAPPGAAPPGAAPPRWSAPPASVDVAPERTDADAAARPAVPPAEPAYRPGLPAGAVPEAGRAALDLVDALARRAWTAAAAALHPDAQAAVRSDALGLLHLDGATVRVRDGLQEGSFPLADVLTGVRSLDDVSDRDLAALYLAGLDALGVWGPAASRVVVGTVADGDLSHVVLRGTEAGTTGLSMVTVVTVRRDGSGRWRALLTEARGY